LVYFQKKVIIPTLKNTANKAFKRTKNSWLFSLRSTF
jgi:hypothetical protein